MLCFNFVMKPHDSNNRSEGSKSSAMEQPFDPLEPPTLSHRPDGNGNDAEDESFAQGDPLWDLLGHAREAEVSPFFARNVLRAARLEADRGSFAEILRALLRWRTVAMAAPALAIALLAATSLNHDSEWNYGAVAAFSPEDRGIDFDIIKNLDELLAMEESSEETALWLNASQP